VNFSIHEKIPIRDGKNYELNIPEFVHFKRNFIIRAVLVCVGIQIWN